MGRFSHLFSNKSNGSPFERSNDYRKNYLKKHKGFFGIYTCAYCGKLCTRSGMQVDHIYPVGGVKTNGLKGFAGRMFITLVSLIHGPTALKDGVNADWNKTAACPRCNGNKSDSMGLWVLRGYVGKILFPIMNLSMAISLIYGVLNTLVSGSPAVFYKALLITAMIKVALFIVSVKVKRR